MSSRTAFGRPSFRALAGLDVGLRVRIRRTQSQGAIFSGAQNLSVQALTSELAEMVAGLVVYSYALRGQLEQVTHALQKNVQSRSWSYARRAALDLAGLLAQAQKPGAGCGMGSRAVRGANCALRVAELCAREAR
jgi:hypothetical protein